MKLPIAWLKDFVEIKEKPEELAKIFTLLGAEVESIQDEVLNLEITPNRSDWLSIYGLAREFAAYKSRPIKRFSQDRLVYQQQSKMLDLTFESKKLFPRYSAIIFDNVEIKSSSPLIQKRLKQFNINVHNNIIDITNYVMIELGLPLHAFDLDEITGHKMTFRESKEGEKLETLDEKIYILPKGSLVIEDAKRLIDLMGIKGGANSGIKKSTKRILLQATVDDPKRIRITSKKIGLTTEASYRFERGVDQQSTLSVLEKAKQLILESCNANILEAVDITNVPTPHRSIKLNPEKVNSLLGTKINQDFAKDTLTRLGFGIREDNVAVPSWRLHDVFYEEDLIEEVARIYGYDKLTKRVLKSQKSNLKNQDEYKKIIKLKNYLASFGFTEIYNYSLVSKQEAGKNSVEIEKSLSPETAYLRTSLLPGIIKTIARNAWYDNIKIFEFGNVFIDGQEKINVALASTTKLPFYLKSEIITPNHQISQLQKLRRTIYFAELPYSEIIKNIKTDESNLKEYKKINYRAISQFPPAVRDIAIILDSSIQPDDIVDSIISIDERILWIELFDEFKSDKFGHNKKSLAFHIIFDDPQKTLNDTEVASLIKKIAQALQKKFQATIR